jgi:hypothetical protein
LILVLCEIDDRPALWAADRLKARGLEVEIVTAPVLGCALRWEHRLSRTGEASVDVELADGRTISSRRPAAVLNRLSFVPTQRLNAVGGADRDYAVQEFNSFFMSWLHALPGPVINRPTPQGLGGNWRHRSVWAALAGEVGIPAVPYRQTCADDPDSGWFAPSSPLTTTVFVIGKTVVAPPIVGADLRAGCLRLAKTARETLLGVELVPGQNHSFQLMTASPVPDLTHGGEPLIDALAERLVP